MSSIPMPPDPWVPTATHKDTKLFPGETMTALDARYPSVSDSGWVNITSLVTIPTGLVWGSGGTMHARRIGNLVALRMDKLLTDIEGFFDVGVTGNIANTQIMSGIPALYRPASFAAGLTAGSSGRMASYYATTAGQVFIAAISPSATQTGTAPLPINEEFSFYGVYPVN